jgi:hypothetical protein
LNLPVEDIALTPILLVFTPGLYAKMNVVQVSAGHLDHRVQMSTKMMFGLDSASKLRAPRMDALRAHVTATALLAKHAIHQHSAAHLWYSRDLFLRLQSPSSAAHLRAVAKTLYKPLPLESTLLCKA